MNNTINL